MLTKDKKRNGSVDFFETPTTVIELIAKYLDKEKIYYDPCVGRGQIPKVLSKNNIEVVGTDIREKNIYGIGGINFLKEDYYNYKEINGFIMNPPFNLSIEFLQKCLDVSKENQDIWIFEKLSFLASKKRSNMMNKNLQGLYVCSKRPSMYAADENLNIEADYIEKKMGGTIDFAWFHFKPEPDKKNVSIISLT